MNYLIFLGKYNEDFCSIEERIINMGLKSIKYPIKYSTNSEPDFVNYPIEGYEFKAWTFTGNVTPLLNIRPLIVKVKIIIFIFGYFMFYMEIINDFLFQRFYFIFWIEFNCN